MTTPLALSVVGTLALALSAVFFPIILTTDDVLRPLISSLVLRLRGTSGRPAKSGLMQVHPQVKRA